jgi:NAD(P)H-nitrite reductase large subunit
MKNKDSDIIICRCEDITRERILECIADGCKTLDEIKCVTRAGMGPCQGRACRNLIAAELSHTHGIPMEDVVMTTFRPPAVPVGLGILADAYDRADEGFEGIEK